MDSNNFGEILKDLRKRAGLTQEQLGEQIGKSKSVVSFYELRERSPSPAILVKLASVFHVSTDYLLGVDPSRRLDVSELSEEDITVITLMIDLLRKKNHKLR
ncbi:MAG: helix-turn-helix domain-containing protein [Eubacterium sp.]|mgnify:CR=1 FL=1|nr:helix-turn-helix domain-containing protein [Eubacterium sp.]